MENLEKVLIDYADKQSHLEHPRLIKTGKEAQIYVVFSGSYKLPE